MATQGPALPPLPSNGDRNRGAAIVATQAIFVAIGTALILARLYVRTVVIRKFGLDDLVILLGLICAITVLATNGLMVHYGIGRHQFFLSLSPQLLQQLSKAVMWQYISQPILIISTMFTKLSICLFLLRIFGTKKEWRWDLYSIIAFVTVTNISSAAIVLAQCQPVQKLWNPVLTGHCWGPDTQIAIGDYNGAVAVFCDWALASLPIALMWNLQISIKLKMGIWVLMGMGFFSGVCAIVRTVLPRNLASTDITWNIVDLDIWAFLEETIGIIAACIPTLKPIFNTSFRYPWNAKSWRRRLARRSAHSDNNHRLHNLGPGLDLNALPASKTPFSRVEDRNYVEISGANNDPESGWTSFISTNGIPREEDGVFAGELSESRVDRHVR